jgi:hypothetical protein
MYPSHALKEDPIRAVAFAGLPVMAVWPFVLNHAAYMAAGSAGIIADALIDAGFMTSSSLCPRASISGWR